MVTNTEIENKQIINEIVCSCKSISVFDNCKENYVRERAADNKVTQLYQNYAMKKLVILPKEPELLNPT